MSSYLDGVRESIIIIGHPYNDLDEELSSIQEEEPDDNKNLVTWDGPDDPKNPQNWSKGYKWWITIICAIISLNSYVFLVPLHQPRLAENSFFR
jgi:hypothetical protein